jgi:hypothetical protein
MPKRGQPSGRREKSWSKRFFLFLFGLAGMGVGIWLFRSRRKRQQGS